MIDPHHAHLAEMRSSTLDALPPVAKAHALINRLGAMLVDAQRPDWPREDPGRRHYYDMTGRPMAVRDGADFTAELLASIRQRQTGVCGIASCTIGRCDLEWGHHGTMHANGDDGFYVRDELAAEHARRQEVRRG